MLGIKNFLAHLKRIFLTSALLQQHVYGVIQPGFKENDNSINCPNNRLFSNFPDTTCNQFDRLYEAPVIELILKETNHHVKYPKNQFFFYEQNKTCAGFDLVRISLQTDHRFHFKPITHFTHVDH